uniref:V-type proton ATPase subunit S1/VOA1 transmembrane domain-containing protein n=1 Tax=Manihot esculenta TaxID=3983 RepID=A0A2C9UFW7_MANES
MAMMVKAVMMSFLLTVTQVPLVLGLQSTTPAFFWSSHHDNRFSNNRMDEAVNYQTISSRDLARSILSEGGWSNLLCSEKKLQKSVDLALVFVGRELLSLDISSNKNADPALLNLLKISFMRSNFSLALPYVAASEEPMENSFVSCIAETCGLDSIINNVAFSESCFIEGDKFQKLADVDAVHDYLVSTMEKRTNGQADLVVFCHGGSYSANGPEQPQTESLLSSLIIEDLISSVETLGAKYEVLYLSDPFRPIQNPSHRELERFLAEGTAGNGPLNSTACDEVCKIKSSLLEGVLVGIVLLIILISGLCCVMGIDTPTKFETPQDS